MPRNRLTPFERLEGPEKPLRESVRQYMDCDYFHKLSPEEKAWYNRFNQHYYLEYGASVHKLKTSNKKNKEIYDKNHTARRSVNVTNIRECVPMPASMTTPSPEDAIIEMIDGDYSERSFSPKKPTKP